MLSDSYSTVQRSQATFQLFIFCLQEARLSCIILKQKTLRLDGFFLLIFSAVLVPDHFQGNVLGFFAESLTLTYEPFKHKKVT